MIKNISIGMEERVTTKDSIGVKDAKGKTRWSLLPFDALEPVVRVLNYGAITKYQFDNWKHVPRKGAYLDAIVRHWHLYRNGEEFDRETGESHLANLACDVLFLIWDRQQKSDVPFDEYMKDLLWYDDYVTELDTKKFD